MENSSKHMLNLENPYYYDSDKNEFGLLKLSIIITHRCSLKCKLSAERVPTKKKNII